VVAETYALDRPAYPPQPREQSNDASPFRPHRPFPSAPSLSFTDAGALPLVYCTVYTALVNYGKLPFDPAPADVGKRSVLILGGSSGTGSVGIQLAKRMGLRVVTGFKDTAKSRVNPVIDPADHPR
jgi:NADPH:quinone reductase-like Zn-dependent oxidoreductase